MEVFADSRERELAYGNLRDIFEREILRAVHKQSPPRYIAVQEN